MQAHVANTKLEKTAVLFTLSHPRKKTPKTITAAGILYIVCSLPQVNKVSKLLAEHRGP